MQSNRSSFLEHLAGALTSTVRFSMWLPVRILTRLAIWRRNAIYLRELERMDPRLLKDVGFKRDEVIAAIREGRPVKSMSDAERMEDVFKERATRANTDDPAESPARPSGAEGIMAGRAGQPAR
ncbi:hypothetical protein DPQ33_02735 [Oceanidesulfovibrio indonesiensis]|uniref:YjiS-like domain-containing protein n=1 Tax=Oceanidesulfovibrio indonesiensis TaxID=54767 RepID=A0A7M3MHX7_9BACT|nr:DUF1127 domain-containing protein [Oceanidesulfovibrio indonesiensis]TVM19294.1 hypothetical protein DPQ33_02735 [Oceanidesulfovibrio indonesiensis]